MAESTSELELKGEIHPQVAWSFWVQRLVYSRMMHRDRGHQNVIAATRERLGESGHNTDTLRRLNHPKTSQTIL
jgi:hypothetical protein